MSLALCKVMSFFHVCITSFDNSLSGLLRLWHVIGMFVNVEKIGNINVLTCNRLVLSEMLYADIDVAMAGVFSFWK